VATNVQCSALAPSTTALVPQCASTLRHPRRAVARRPCRLPFERSVLRPRVPRRLCCSRLLRSSSRPVARCVRRAPDSPRSSWADVTEGNPWPIGLVWERLHYDWSQPGIITGKVIDSNIFRWELRVHPPVWRESSRGHRHPPLEGERLVGVAVLPSRPGASRRLRILEDVPGQG